jgi:plastocyanin
MMSFRLGAILVAAMCITACGSSSSSPTPSPTPTPTPTPTPAPGAGTTVTIVTGARSLTTNAYSPNPVTVAVGTTVTWVNNDTTAHTATSNGGAFDTGTIAAGGSGSFRFQTAGSFPYHCTFHPGMIATITVQ